MCMHVSKNGTRSGFVTACVYGKRCNPVAAMWIATHPAIKPNVVSELKILSPSHAGFMMQHTSLTIQHISNLDRSRYSRARLAMPSLCRKQFGYRP